jgi:hypothetical protein
MPAATKPGLLMVKLEGRTDDGAEIPLPRPIAEHCTNPDLADLICAILKFAAQPSLESGRR